MSINPLKMAAEVSESDEREDGEIVDDDFEEISDYSIPSCGKSDSSQDLLRAISLSSISGSDGERVHKNKHYLPPCKKRRKHHDHHHKKKRKREDIYSRYAYPKKRRRKHSTSDDSDMERLDRRTLRQLKEAVRINTTGELTTNSLRSRLKAMMDPDSDDEDIDTLRTLALLTSKTDNIDDSLENKINIEESVNDISIVEDEIDTTYDKELEELRLEALKSAVIKKHTERKRRKEMLNRSNINTETVMNNVINNEINKENTESNNINDNIEQIVKIDQKIIVPITTDIEKVIDHETNDFVTTIEEDVDIMRAMLLASMSTKITSLPNTITESDSKKKLPLVSSQLSKKNLKPNLPLPTKKVSQAKNISNLKMPSVKPLIININNDSDTESDFDPIPPKPVHNIPLDKSVTEFLRKQREQFEAKQILLKPKIQQLEEKKAKNTILDKSVVKLLSKSQQNEYRFLQQKLLDANTKRKIRRLSIKLRNNKELVNNEEKRNPSELKKTLQDLQTHKNGRLQMKGKYRDLAPLLEKVNHASNKRKLCEATIKELLGRLQAARNDLAASHEKFTDLVQELIKCKELIDTGLIVNPPPIFNETQSPVTMLPTQTSTPIKLPAKNSGIPDKVALKTSEDNLKNAAEAMLPTQTPIKLPAENPGIAVKMIEDTLKNSVEAVVPIQSTMKLPTKESEIALKMIENHLKNAKEKLKMFTENKKENDMTINKEMYLENAIKGCITDTPVDELIKLLGTTEDIKELKITNIDETESSVAKYVSPLDNRSSVTTNPLEMLCPYELFGVCKDHDCKFNHCP